MRIVYGDIWTYHQRGAWAVIPTNTTVNSKGEAVMGAGLAKQAAERYPGLPRMYGETLKLYANQRFDWCTEFFEEFRLVCLPTKDDWRKPSEMWMLESSLAQFLMDAKICFPTAHFALPPLGCGCGGLDWETQVRTLLERYLTDDRFAVVLPKPG